MVELSTLTEITNKVPQFPAELIRPTQIEISDSRRSDRATSYSRTNINTTIKYSRRLRK